jgi:thermitase
MRLRVLCYILLLVSCLTGAQAAQNSLRFQPAQRTLDARVAGWTLDELLAHLSGATGWEVYVDPDAAREINARFENLPVGEALGRLLGSLNYALLPRDGAPDKLLVFRTNAQEATRRVKSARPADQRIGNELILTLKNGSGVAPETLARQIGAKITGRIDKLGAYRLEFADDAAAQAARDALASNNLVESVSDNYWIDAPPAAERLAASSTVPFSLKPTASTDTSRLVIGLVDTGVQPLGAAYDAFLLKAISIDPDYTPGGSTPTHGTSMAETILRGLSVAVEDGGNSSTTRILPVDIYGASANTTSFNVAWGVSTAVDNGATLINLSLGSSGDSKLLQTVIENAAAQGVVFFAAAGNTPTDAPTYPAAYPSVTAVTAGDKRGNLASYANYGSFVDVVGPGTSIVSYNGRSYLVSGTSSATAFISGMAAGTANLTGRSLTSVQTSLRQSLAYRPTTK